ncbi:MAG: hypothetical protein CHACPFDD_02511 [Phycisphaerae bacterium]|nr:hypothetical protein [Phycisphaerae bacterium]
MHQGCTLRNFRSNPSVTVGARLEAPCRSTRATFVRTPPLPSGLGWAFRASPARFQRALVRFCRNRSRAPSRAPTVREGFDHGGSRRTHKRPERLAGNASRRRVPVMKLSRVRPATHNTTRVRRRCGASGLHPTQLSFEPLRYRRGSAGGAVSLDEGNFRSNPSVTVGARLGALPGLGWGRGVSQEKFGGPRERAAVEDEG